MPLAADFEWQGDDWPKTSDGATGPARLILWHGNLDAIVASHQDAILGPAQMGNTHRQPYADRQQSDGERDSRYIRQHSLSVIIRFIRHALVAR